MKWPVLFIGIVLITGVIIFAIAYGSPSVSSVATSTTEIITNIPSVTYQNNELGFSVMHPATSNVVTENFEGYLPVTGHAVAGFPLPPELFQGTNLIEAGIYVGASNDPKTVNACRNALDREKTIGVTMIGPESFTSFNADGIGAGNIYDQTVYRTVRNGYCYEITKLLHSGNIANYPVGQVNEFDNEKFKTMLDTMLDTFMFTANIGSGVEGSVQMHCATDVPSADCVPQPRTIGVYQGVSAVGLFKTDENGAFRAELPAGQYELRIDTTGTTHCASVGIVVPHDVFVTTSISCEVGTK